MTTRANTNQQSSVFDEVIEDEDVVEVIKAWWESEVALNVAEQRIGHKTLKKNLKDAKDKATQLLTPDPNKKKRIQVKQGNWATVIEISPGGDPIKIPAGTRANNPRFKLNNTEPPAD